MQKTDGHEKIEFAMKNKSHNYTTYRRGSRYISSLSQYLNRNNKLTRYVSSYSISLSNRDCFSHTLISGWRAFRDCYNRDFAAKLGKATSYSLAIDWQVGFSVYKRLQIYLSFPLHFVRHWFFELLKSLLALYCMCTSATILICACLSKR